MHSPTDASPAARSTAPAPLVVLVAALAAALVLAAPVRGAATITVCPSGCDHATVAAAVAAAAPGDRIEVGAGRYEGELRIDKGLTIEGEGAEDGASRTEIAGRQQGSTVFIGTSQRVELRGLRVSGGNGVEFDGVRYGGGIYMEGDVDVLLEDMVVAGNEGAWEGGGIYLNDGALEVNRLVVRENRAYEAGAGIYANTAGVLTIRDTEIRDNVARNPEGGEEFSFANGGGLALRGRATGEGLRIEDNEAEAFGGALYVFAQGDLELSDSRIAGNTAGKSGGGIWTSIEVAFDGLDLVDNVAGEEGGGLYNIGTARIDDARIQGNRAVNGGGIHNQKGFAAQQLGELAMSFVTLADNEASGIGGALVVRDEGRATCDLCTLSGNRAPEAGTIEENGAERVELTHATIYSRGGTALRTAGSRVFRLGYSLLVTEGDAEAINCTGEFASLGHNLDSDGTCGLDRQGDLVRGETGIEPLADNGGRLPTHGLVEDSPAIDAGHPNRCPETDQRGFPAPIDGDGDGQAQCDIGAFEYGSQAPGEATPTPQASPPTPTPGDTPEPGETPSPTPTSSDPAPTGEPIYLPRTLKDG